MAVTVRFLETTATVEDGEWKSDDPVLQQDLNTMSGIDSVSPFAPQPDRQIAVDMATILGGENVEEDENPPENMIEGQIY